MAAPSSSHTATLAQVYAILRAAAQRAREQAAATAKEPQMEGPTPRTTAMPAGEGEDRASPPFSRL
jgi:hypothetical protein